MQYINREQKDFRETNVSVQSQCQKPVQVTGRYLSKNSVHVGVKMLTGNMLHACATGRNKITTYITFPPSKSGLVRILKIRTVELVTEGP